MLSMMIKGVTAFIAAFTYINLLPIPTPFRIEDLLVELILNPMGFLTAMISFLIGFLCLGNLIQETILLIKLRTIKLKIKGVLLVPLLSIFSLLLLLQVSFWHMIVFYGFGIFYGMMSLKEKTVNGG